MAEGSSRKVFAGPRLKRLRRDRQLTQARMAEDLEVSPSYLNLMERNQRPLTVQVLIRLTDVYGIDPRDFMTGESEQSISELDQILADPLLRETPVPRTELQDAAEHSPALLVAVQRLYRAYTALPMKKASSRGTPTAPNRISTKIRSIACARFCTRRVIIFRNSMKPPKP
jgi:transcriptional regulator with XRE-family HTH domain